MTTTKRSLWNSWHSWVAIATIPLFVLYVVWWYLQPDSQITNQVRWCEIPLLIILLGGGLPMVWELVVSLVKGRFGSDLLAAVSILTSLWLGEYLAGAIVVLMLSGGQALEAYAVRNASAVLEALANRVPTQVHRRVGDKEELIGVEHIQPGDILRVYPHEICPADGVIVSGRGSMDESYLSGEPYLVSKSIGSQVISGAINGSAVLEVEATRAAKDSRYAKIMRVMQDSAQQRPQLRRLGDQLGAIYTPIAIAIALLAWWWSGEALRFLAVMVVATPCPLLIAIPVAVIGSISLAARYSIIIKDPAVLERLDLVKTAMFDKTGTLTYGRPEVTAFLVKPGVDADQLLQLAASLERYSKHPLASAVLKAAEAKSLTLLECREVHEEPGMGLIGRFDVAEVIVTNRSKANLVEGADAWLGPRQAGMECVILVDGELQGAIQFRDQPRADGKSFVEHLLPKHGIKRVLLISGDREEEVKYLADKMGIKEVYASQSPEQKLAIVRRETELEDSLYVGDGINDAPALTAATIGIAFGKGTEITGDAADAVILDSSLKRVDQLMHIGRRMRRIALQSAIGGMGLSLLGMGFAAAGYLHPVAGALLQELIDIIAVLNALRAAYRPRSLSDFDSVD